MEKIKQFAPLAQVILTLIVISYIGFSIGQFVIDTMAYQQSELQWRAGATQAINNLIQQKDGKQN